MEKNYKSGKIDWFRAFKYNEIGEYESPDIQLGKGQFGRGVFAKKKIQPGQLLMIERPMI